MKTNKLLPIIAIILFITSCTKEISTEYINEIHSKVTITGNSTNGYTNNETRASSIEQISIGDSILFYSTGGVTANGDILKYENGQWSGLKNDKWNTDNGPANIVAFYPVIKDINDLYYENGELKDIVCCKDTVEIGKTINLSFKHIFAKLVFNIDKELNDTIQQVHINIPQKVTDINLNTGEYTISDNDDNFITQDRNESGKYEFFIPCKSKMTISLKLECNNTILDDITVKDNMLFNSGFEYICNVRKNTEKGIYTTEDFIAFTHLINNENGEYNGKKIEDFYTEIDGRRVFNLYNDLSFTDEEATLIRRIGERNKVFKDIFDGNNHTLDNITLNQDISSSNKGLFDKISEESIIRNLTLSNCKYSEKTVSDNTSLFVGYNSGLIENCHIISGIIPGGDMTRIAGFNTNNFGYIINCSIGGLKFDETEGYHGIFCYSNHGNIMNCRIKNDLNKISKGSTSSIICSINAGNLFNIFVEKYINGFYGICNENNSIGQYYNCFIPNKYSDTCINTDNNNSELLKGKYLYSESETEYKYISEKLNNWIENEGKNLYPQFTFRKWKTDPTEKVIFE